jgi:isoamylase
MNRSHLKLTAALSLEQVSALSHGAVSAQFGAHYVNPQQAHVNGIAAGVNFSIWSDHATDIDLCLFDTDGKSLIAKFDLFSVGQGVFNGFVEGAQPGLVYSFRVDGPNNKDSGQCSNPLIDVLDPYATQVVGPQNEQGAWIDNGTGFRARVSDQSAQLESNTDPLYKIVPAVERPLIARADLVLYEIHVKGFSQLNELIPAHKRGRYAGLADPAAIAYFKKIGVTTLSILPVQALLDEPALRARGVSNYWGYNTLAFNCIDPRFATHPTDPVAVRAEFLNMVRCLHAHQIEVVLDVVYNHTAEGGVNGPALSFRGLDNTSWYRGQINAQGVWQDDNCTGCGNSLNLDHPRVCQFVIDSLRYWVRELEVDGFRFDLASVLGRTATGFDPKAPFFKALQRDALLSQVHLIAEPWDATADGYQLGHYPAPFMDWNDKFRDSVRRFWLGGGVTRAEFALRLAGSSDIFNRHDRGPLSSINYVAVHDGFTLFDLCSFDHKHNQQNGENNRDGRDGEPAHCFGVEGPTTNPTVLANRAKARRAILATNLLAQGVPMIQAGDELGRTQNGNNNAYCQDNALTWINWSTIDQDLLAMVQHTTVLRRQLSILRNSRWFEGQAHADYASMEWFDQQAQPLNLQSWHNGCEKVFYVVMRAGLYTSASKTSSELTHLAILFNPTNLHQPFAMNRSGPWQVLLNTASNTFGIIQDIGSVADTTQFDVDPLGLLVLGLH